MPSHVQTITHVLSDWSVAPFLTICSAGVCATYISWALRGSSRGGLGGDATATRGLMAAAFAACCVTRTASLSAFSKTGRGMAAADIITELTQAAESRLAG